MKTKQILILFVSLFALFASGQQPFYRQMNASNGLQGESVYVIKKGQRNIFWIGTNNGLRCYNGKRMYVFSSDCSKPLCQVNDIMQLPEGDVYVGMKAGLYKADKTTLTCQRVFPEIPAVSSLCMVGEVLLVGGEGLWKYSGDEQPRRITLDNSVISKGNMVNDMAPDGKDGAWICTNKQIIHYRLSDDNISRYPLPDSLLTGNLNKVCFIDGKLYLGTSNSGLLRFDIKTKQTSRYMSLATNVIAGLNTDGLRYLYVSSDGDGGYVIDVSNDSVCQRFMTRTLEQKEGLSGYPHLENNFPTDAVYTFWKDKRNGIFWYGFYEEGLAHTLHQRQLFELFRFDGVSVENLKTRSFHIHDDVMALGTHHGLYLFDIKDHRSRFISGDEIGGNIVTNIKFFGGKFVVANFERGLSVIDPRTFQVQHLASHEALSKGNFSKLCVDEAHRQLVAICNLGVVVLDQDFHVVRWFTSRNSELPDEYLYDIMFDKTGKAWISSLSRLSIYDPKTQTIQSNGFPENFFNQVPNLSFNLMPNGDVIAFSQTQVFRSKADLSQFAEIPLYKELQIGNIYFITFAGGHYWVATDRGLFVYDDDSFRHPHHFNLSDGLPSLKFNRQEYQATPDSTLWLCTSEGIVSITSERMRQWDDTTKQEMMVGRLLVNHKEWSDAQVLQLDDDRDITLTWNFGSQSIEVSALDVDYSTEGGKYYEYAVDDSEFTICSEDSLFLVSSLSLGKHTLKIRLAGYKNTLSTYQITVIPSALFWFELLFGILVVFSIWMIVKYRKNRRILRQLEQLQHQEDLREAATMAVEEHKKREEERRHAELEAKQQQMYQKSKLNDEEFKVILKKLKAYMDDKKPYKNPELRISDLADAIGTTTAKLSQMFSKYVKHNFFDFVNTYRINEFKRMIADEKFNHFTVTAISEKCGFKKSSFFAAFKKFENCTPTEYLKKNHIDRT